MYEMTDFIIPLVIMIVVFFILRELFCWYWKFNAILKELKTVNMNIVKMITFMGNQERVDRADLQEKDGICYKVNEEKPFTGKCVSYYADGQIRALGNYVNGKLDGEYIAYYENGEVITKVYYSNGVEK